MGMYRSKAVIFSIIIVGLTMIGCQQSLGKQHIIASIPEASGIGYCSNSDTLVVANDEGYFYEIGTNGTIMYKHNIGKYDLEGVVCEDNNFIFALESGGLIKVDRLSQSKQYIHIEGLGKFGKKRGIEGIAKMGDKYILSLQTLSKKDAKLFVVEIDDNKAKVIDEIYHEIEDSSGLEMKNGILYIVSDTKNRLYLYSMAEKKILSTLKLSEFNQEGIAIDNSDNIYFADDKGYILKYRIDELGIN
ncbi:MAG: SdiA-regulated domain-containing protein [Campylobacterales bacterium]|nr:SdiA-regulated domain-containing protein [Campylobacterales bacterium]